MNFTDDYHQILTSARPMIDLRAPIEFEQGAFEGSQSLPLMTDDERAMVGTCYKQHGQDAAIKLGHQLVSGETLQQRMAGWISALSTHQDPLIYCFRGGLRSQTVAGFLADAGQHVTLVKGGYKAMRRYLIDQLETIVQQQPMIVVAGPTGSGKTKVLTQITHQVDLEGLANHRGSAFGGMLTPQPTQISFENRVSASFIRQVDQRPPAIFVEDEGRLIGRCALPVSLLAKIGESPRVLVDEPLDYRISVIMQDYVIEPAIEYQQALGDQWQQAYASKFLDPLSRIVKRLGGERHQRIKTLIERALTAQFDTGNLTLHHDWIGELLANYYDPMYAYQLSKKQNDPLFVGDSSAVVEWAEHYLRGNR